MSRPLALGFVGMGWVPDVGGVESHTHELSRELLRRGHRVAAFALDFTDGLEPYSTATREQEGVRVTRLAYRFHDHRALADLLLRPRASAAVVAWARAERLDLVHVHHASGHGLAIVPALAHAAIPVVMTLHDYWPICPRGQMLRTDGAVCATVEPARCAPCLAATWPHLMPSRGGEARGARGEALADDGAASAAHTSFALACLHEAHALFTPSAATRAVFVRAGVPERRIRVVPNGVEVEALAREVAALRAQEPPRAGLRLGVLGTVLPSKGALELAEALCAADVPGLTLEIHGNEPSYHGDTRYVERLRALATREPRVRLHGPFEHRDLARILAGLDGVAAPSRTAGLPVLVSDAGDLPGVTDGGAAGLVVPAEDRAAWIAALRRFADPAERARWSAHPPRPRTTAQMTDQLEAAYREVLRPPPWWWRFWPLKARTTTTVDPF